MKVQYANDENRGRGYAGFRCLELADPAALYSFSLCRASDLSFLGRSGWQTAEEKHRPDSQEQDDHVAILQVGPHIVDCLDENENYRLTIYAQNLAPQKASFSITAINRSLRASSDLIQASVPQTPKEKNQVQPAPEPAPEPESLPATESPKRSTIAPLLIGLLILALTGGGTAWWFMNHKADDGTVATQKDELEKPEQVKVEEPRKAEEGKVENPVEPEAGKAEAEQKTDPPKTVGGKEEQAVTPVLSAREQTRSYLGGTPNAQGALELSRNLLASPEGDKPDTRDAIYRLLYFASRQGDAEASLALAKIVDPATPAWGTMVKDGREAWTYYTKAAGQKTEASEALATLKKWLEDEAGKGNAQALQWIDDIRKENAPLK